MERFDLDDFVAACIDAVHEGNGPMAIRDLLDRSSEHHESIPDGLGVEAAGGARLAPGDVAMLGRDAVHDVRAHPSRYTGAIHVYDGDYFDRVRSTWGEDGAPLDDSREVGGLFEEAETAWQARHHVG